MIVPFWFSTVKTNYSTICVGALPPRKSGNGLEVRDSAFEAPISSWIGSPALDRFAFGASSFSCSGIHISFEFGGDWFTGIWMDSKMDFRGLRRRRRKRGLGLAQKLLEFALIFPWKRKRSWAVHGDIAYEGWGDYARSEGQDTHGGVWILS